MTLVTAGTVEASPSGYVYVPVRAGACAQASPCAAPQLLVFDPSTTRQVIAIDLPVHTMPAGVAISPDGKHLYVSNRGVEFSTGNSLSIIDARHHALLATVSVTPYGPLAVARDDRRVFLLDSSSGLNAFDTASRTITAATDVQGLDIAASSSLDRVFVLGELATYAFDTVSLAPVGQPARNGYRQRIRASRNGLKLFDAGVFPFVSHCPGCGSGQVFDALTLGALVNYSFIQDVVPAAELGASQLVTFYLGNRALIDASTGATTDTKSVGGFAFVVDFDVLSPGTSAAVLHRTFPPPGTPVTTSIAIVDIATATVTKATAAIATQPAGADRIVSTPWSAESCSYRLDSTSASFSRTGSARPFDPISGEARILVTTDCAFSVTSDASWIHVGPTSGTSSRYVSIGVDQQIAGAPTRTGHVVIGGQVVTVTQAGAQSRAPVGFVDTPSDFASGVSGAIGVTGWAVDDLAVTRVRIYRGRLAGEAGPATVYLGDATLVEGARPDVQALYPDAPFASRAGWGYQLLTNTLPGGGNGTFTLYVYADDLEGNEILLGTRTISVNNTSATTPFGAVDVPAQGEIVTGVITNWGWALTPPNGSIPVDGSTIDVLIDGVAVGHPTYGLNRSDVASLFPGYANTNAAVGYFTIDTTLLINGVHTIAWVVRDSLGRAQGIGSRYFTVQNP